MQREKRRHGAVGHSHQNGDRLRPPAAPNGHITEPISYSEWVGQWNEFHRARSDKRGAKQEKAHGDDQTTRPARIAPTPTRAPGEILDKTCAHVLHVLDRHGVSLRQEEIAGMLRCARSTVRPRLERMLAAGMVDRPLGQRGGYVCTEAGRSRLIGLPTRLRELWGLPPEAP